MKINVLPVGELYTNCYIIESNNKNAIVIDPGDNPQGIIKFCADNSLEIKILLFTHGHFDHTGGTTELLKKTDAKTYIHKLDEEFLIDPKKTQSRYFDSFGGYVGKPADFCYKDKDIIKLDDIKLTVIHTPGHTEGSSVFIGDDIIFTGDTLFCGGVGRTDLVGGDERKIINSLKKLASLKGNYQVLTGHGAATTLDDERRTNPYMGTNDESIFSF